LTAGLVKIVHLSREHVRANQLLTILSDEVRALGARRLVLDGASQIVSSGASAGDLRPITQALTTRFKSLGVTSLITVEAKSLFSEDVTNDYGLSPVADNVIRLRYVRVPGGLRPVLNVLKTRGSAHDRGTHQFGIGRGGLSVMSEAELVAADDSLGANTKGTVP
jgi:circadian clock protein KaiC